MNRLQVRRFAAEDFPVYRRWYADPLLDHQLGPMDDDWLDSVLTDPQQEAWSAFVAGQLVAVIGLSFDPETNFWVITDIAVDPARRRQGLGRTALQALLAYPELAGRKHWRALVADDNPQSQAFFTALGWQRLGTPTSDDPFWTYVWHA